MAMVVAAESAAKRQRLRPAWRHTSMKSLIAPRGFACRQMLEGLRRAIAGR
jgi:hypothetical protein